MLYLFCANFIDTFSFRLYNEYRGFFTQFCTQNTVRLGVINMATINDIAKIAGVSTSTVSHTVNKTRYVSPELVERVEKAIQELDQLPNFVRKKANTLTKSTSTKYILFLISDKKSTFQQQVESQVDELLSNTEYVLITLNYCKDNRRLEILDSYFMNTPGLAGIIAFPDEDELALESMLGSVKLPVVILGREMKNFTTDSIVSDTFDGAYKATKHLIKNGHEHIAFLGSAQNRNPQRLGGYCKALKDYDISFNPDYAISNLNSETEIFGRLDNMLSGNQIPTAVLAANFSTVLPLFKYIEAHNILCPKDLSIVSFNDFEWAPLHTPPITCVKQNTSEFARLAVSMLMERIYRSESANAPTHGINYKHIVLPTKLNVRASTCGIGRGPFGEKAENADSLILSEQEMEMIRNKGYSAAISFHYAGKAWMQLQQKGIKEIFDHLGISIIAITDAHFKPELQCKQLDSLLLLEPDVIIAIPTDNTQTSEAFKRIATSNSKLVLIANIPDGLTSSDYVSCVSTNEHSHGRNMGQGLGEYMLKHGLKNVGLIKHGVKNFYTTNQRDNAAEQVLVEEFPEITICGTIEFAFESEVFQKTYEFIKRNPSIEALYVSWDGPAMEVISALSEATRTDIVVVTGDLDYPIAMNMAKGGMIKMLSAQCPFEQGQAIALAAANSLLGKATPSFIGVEPISVTCENLLKSWKQVFKEDPPLQLKEAFRQNPNYVVDKIN